VATGTEIALGRTVDTNCAFLAELLGGWGVRVQRHLTVPDDPYDIAATVRECFARFDVTVMTGGLGPTEDDWTRLAAARAFSCPLVFSHELASDLRGRMRGWGFACPDNNLRQAWIPAAAYPVPNPRGTAPAFAVRRGGRAAVFLPGVPREAEHLARTALREIVLGLRPGGPGAVRTFVLKAAGLGEGKVDDLLKDILRGSENPYVGLSAGQYETKILVTVQAADAESAEALAAPVLAEIERRLGASLAGSGEGGLRASVAERLREGGRRLGVVDSITGGVLARSLLEHLPPECLAGAVSCRPGAASGLNALNYLSAEGADLVMSLHAQTPLPASSGDCAEGTASVTVVTHIRDARPRPQWGRRRGGKSDEFFQITPLAGPEAHLRERVAALACFQLWEFLRDKG
jgi:nicotinamide-nucleotide amidase